MDRLVPTARGFSSQPCRCFLLPPPCYYVVAAVVFRKAGLVARPLGTMAMQAGMGLSKVIVLVGAGTLMISLFPRRPSCPVFYRCQFRRATLLHSERVLRNLQRIPEPSCCGTGNCLISSATYRFDAIVAVCFAWDWLRS